MGSRAGGGYHRSVVGVVDRLSQEGGAVSCGKNDAKRWHYLGRGAAEPRKPRSLQGARRVFLLPSVVDDELRRLPSSHQSQLAKDVEPLRGRGNPQLGLLQSASRA